MSSTSQEVVTKGIPDVGRDALENMRATVAAVGDKPPTRDAAQELLAAAVQLHVALCQACGSFPAFTDRNRVSATEVVIAASHMLEAADIEVFELQLWEILGTK